MAKKFRRMMALALALVLCFAQMAMPASAHDGWDKDDKKPGSHQSSEYEWYQVYVQGNLVASAQGTAGDNRWLGITYSASITTSGNSVTWYIKTNNGTNGDYSGTVNLDVDKYVNIPAGYELAGVTVKLSSVEGDNSVPDQYDNAIVTITVETLLNKTTGETVPVEEVPTPTQTSVTVNHIYSTYDAYTGNTVEDGRTSGTSAATEGDTFTATPVPSYNGNDYTQTTEASFLTITVDADAGKNVVNIHYLRSVDTTPVDYEPVLTVTKTADKEVYETGETITWTITVTNTSDYTAYDVSITDALTGDSWSIDSLAPGASQSFSAATNTEAAGAVQNIAVASWTDNDDIPDDEEDEPKTAQGEETVQVEEPTEPEVTEPEVTEPEPTEPEPTEPEPTEPEPTEPEPTEPEPTEPEVTEPEVTEPEVTEPEVTEPEVTEPEVTEPEVTEPEVTEPEVTEPEVTEPEVTEPEVTEPEVTEPAPAAAEAQDDGFPIDDGGYVEIIDEDVPLADVPQTGDSSILWAALSLVSGGMFVLNRKRKDEE